ncbi:MAG: tetratricopeptide repeat protein [Pseudomonadota bacterium]
MARFGALMRAMWLGLLVTVAPLPAGAVFSGDMSPRAPSGDIDYATGQAAFKARDWSKVVNNMLRVVARRPWHDNAHTYLGYAYRQLDNYDAALRHYALALDHHPRNRRALSYLGEAYLALGDQAKAEEMLDRLRAVCINVAVSFSDGGFTSGCEEFNELWNRYEFFRLNGTMDGSLKNW